MISADSLLIAGAIILCAIAVGWIIIERTKGLEEIRRIYNEKKS